MRIEEMILRRYLAVHSRYLKGKKISCRYLAQDIKVSPMRAWRIMAGQRMYIQEYVNMLESIKRILEEKRWKRNY